MAKTWYSAVGHTDTETVNGETYQVFGEDQINDSTRLSDVVGPQGHYGGFVTIGLKSSLSNSEFRGVAHLIEMEADWERNDLFITQDKDDIVAAGGGHDFVSTETGNDQISGGTGNDRLYAGGGNDTVYGGEGNDRISGDGTYVMDTTGDGIGVRASIFGGYNWNIIKDADFVGIQDSDELGNDKLYGDAGNDTIDGRGGNDTIFGGADNDVLKGGGDQDYLNGGTGNDTLDGGHGGDELWGGNGDDVLISGERNDKGATDMLYGGEGADTFVLTSSSADSATQAADTLGDFFSDAAEGFAQDAVLKIVGIAAASAGPVSGFLVGQATGLVFDLVGLARETTSDVQSEDKADTVKVLDFDPTEDVIYLPKGSYGSGETYTMEVRSVQNGGEFQQALVIEYGQGADKIEFATIFLSEKFLREMNISASGDTAADIFEQVKANAVQLDNTGASNVIGENGSANDGNIASDGLFALGAVSALVSINPDIDDGAPVIGTQFGDVLGGNYGWAKAGSEADATAQIEVEEGIELWGFDGDDMIQGTAASDTLNGGNGDDTIYTMGSRGGLDRVDAGNGDDIIFVGADYGRTEYSDRLLANGQSGDDTVSFEFASQGVRLADNNGDISAHDKGGPANQYEFFQIENFVGSDHRDVFDFSTAYFGIGADGGKGNDKLVGSDHGDTLAGGAGDDQIIGNDGNDKLIGNRGADTFVFADDHGKDRIKDFNTDQGDMIDLSDVADITGFRDMKNNHITQSGDDLIIHTGNGNDRIIIEDTTMSDLTSDAFIF